MAGRARDDREPDASASPRGAATRQPGLTILTRRADFLRAASARRQSGPGFLLQARLRGEGEDPGGMRVGFTCSKKLGNAVTRNRAKRRLRVVARTVLPSAGQPGWDYVLVGRPRETISRDFAALLADCRTALARIHREAAGQAAGAAGPRHGRPGDNAGGGDAAAGAASRSPRPGGGADRPG